MVPVTIRMTEGAIVGFTESFSGTTVSVQALSGTAAAGEACRVRFHLLGGEASASGRMTRVDPVLGHYELELTRVTDNGPALLHHMTGPDP